MGRQQMADLEDLKKENKKPENTSWKKKTTNADGQTDSQFIIKNKEEQKNEMVSKSMG